MIVTFDSYDVRYTDPIVMAKVTQAERWVNEYCGQSFTGTIPDGVVFATLELARHFWNLQFLEDDHIEELPKTLSEILPLIYEALDKNKVTISYSSSASNYHLPSLKG